MERPACHPGGWCGAGRREDRATAFSQSRLQLLNEAWSLNQTGSV